MPKVKFTALVSDMKGKANGSVFASNNGGTYFRTNKTGGGRKSNAWNTQKAGFADLSSMYRALTVEQQQAWKDARSLYPTTNAFGEPRIPTAFELFMRLNGKLLAAGLDLISVPQTPREFPDYAAIKIAIPDSYLFHPKTLIKPETQSGQKIMFYRNNLFTEFDPQPYNVVSCRFIPSVSTDNWILPNKTYGLFRFFDGDDIIAAAQIHIDINNQITLNFGYRVWDDAEGPLVFINRYSIPASLISKQIHFSAQFSSQAPTGLEVYINGSNIELLESGVTSTLDVDTIDLSEIALDSVPSWDPVTGGTFSPGAVLTDLNPDLRGPFSVSDFRVYQNQSLTEVCSNNNPCDEGFQCYGGQCSVPDWFTGNFIPVWAEKLYRGNVLGTESIAYGLENIISLQGATFVTDACESSGNASFMLVAYVTNPGCGDECVGNDFECQGGVCVYVGDRNIMFRDNILTAGPLTALQRIAIEGEGYYMQLYYSGLVSGGRDGNQIPYKLLGTFPINENSTNISERILELTGNFSPDCNFFFKASIIDGTTGVVYNTEATISLPPNRNVRRFKAGTTLAGKVN
jgi:hypothetical protein